MVVPAALVAYPASVAMLARAVAGQWAELAELRALAERRVLVDKTRVATLPMPSRMPTQTSTRVTETSTREKTLKEGWTTRRMDPRAEGERRQDISG
jgi:hypothetical protein